MKRKINKHLGMDQDELAASFAGRLSSKTKRGKSPKEGLGLTDREVEEWNKKLTATLANKAKKKK